MNLGHHHDDEFLDPSDGTGEEWNPDDVEMTTVGIDIGSSTSHLMFSRIHLRRLGKSLTSRYVVVGREVLHRSPIHFTPYRDDQTIDAEVLSGYIQEAFEAAGLSPEAIDSGAVILTGEAMRRVNARPIAELFAGQSGQFVCATAGHHLEAQLSAQGSGAVELSRTLPGVVLNVDVGGGTSKLALADAGEIVGTASINVGGRLIALDSQGRLDRIEPAAQRVADHLGLRLQLGEPVTTQTMRQLAQALAQALTETIAGLPGVLARELMLTEPMSVPPRIDRLNFSGGVAEFIYGREAGDFQDLSRPLAEAIRAGQARLDPPLEAGIRATAIGASQFTVQVSGDTLLLSRPGLLPIHNLPVLKVRLPSADPSPAQVGIGVADAFRRQGREPGSEPVALAVEFAGIPSYANLRALAEGLRAALDVPLGRGTAVALVFSADISQSVGEILRSELGVAGDLICIDGVELRDLDFIDVGALLPNRRVVPVVVKTLLFAPPHPASERVVGAG
ncbi:MAG TPA: ethanolamine ammonia-lyase reactivating factor EutA [Candidatus Nitrosotalea sp.]|nr:ethanolamine ammonia-lyase reactivating factor EutA [Candidatus Nitrosotalea sp.]